MLREINRNDMEELRTYLQSRSQEIDGDILKSVIDILNDVHRNGDQAVKAYTKKFDGVEEENFRVSPQEIDELAAQCSNEFKEAMKKAADNIAYFHQAQVQQSYLQEKEMGIYLGQRVLPLAAVGIYVPGGRAQYPSSVLMNAIPARIAGVKRIVMMTPPDKNGKIPPTIAFAAKTAGVTEIYKIGGAQAVAAMAYGTESIDFVDKIVGPGNIYVAAAKKLVYGKVDIDMIAGPSEILVVADENARPDYVAADLISQAEHDPMASPILLTVSSKLLAEVDKELQIQTDRLERKEIIRKSLHDYGRAIVCDTIEECISFANAIAPEHLELCVRDPMTWLNQVNNAGSVFLGYYTCEPIGDYFGGTNHVLPTNGTARFSSALGVDAFVKKSSFLHYTKEALDAYGSSIIELANAEHLTGHANAVRVRMNSDERD